MKQRRVKQKERKKQRLKVVDRNVLEVGVNGGVVLWCCVRNLFNEVEKEKKN